MSTVNGKEHTEHYRECILASGRVARNLGGSHLLTFFSRCGCSVRSLLSGRLSFHSFNNYNVDPITNYCFRRTLQINWFFLFDLSVDIGKQVILCCAHFKEFCKKMDYSTLGSPPNTRQKLPMLKNIAAQLTPVVILFGWKPSIE